MIRKGFINQEHTEEDIRNDTGCPHDGRGDKATYWHDRRVDKGCYLHDREIDIQMLKMFINGYILRNPGQLGPGQLG